MEDEGVQDVIVMGEELHGRGTAYYLLALRSQSPEP